MAYRSDDTRVIRFLMETDRWQTTANRMATGITYVTRINREMNGQNQIGSSSVVNPAVEISISPMNECVVPIMRQPASGITITATAQTMRSNFEGEIFSIIIVFGRA
jgi:hypothetical protein